MSIPIDQITEGWYWAVNTDYEPKIPECVEVDKGCGDFTIIWQGGWSYLDKYIFISRISTPEKCGICEDGVIIGDVNLSALKIKKDQKYLCPICKGSGWKI